MNMYVLSAIVIIILLIIAFGMRVLRGLRSNTTPIYYKALLVLSFVILIVIIVWELFHLHIL